MSEEAKTPAVELPEGVTQAMIDDWKKRFGKVAMVRISGVRCIVRIVLRGEVAELQKTAPTNESITEAIIRLGGLFIEDRPARDSAGFQSSLLAMIGKMSGTDDSELYYFEDFSTADWEAFLKTLPEAKHPPMAELAEKFDALWLMRTDDDDIYVLTYVNRKNYEDLLEQTSDPAARTERMVLHGLAWPRLAATADLRALPYGTFQSIHDHIVRVSGFMAEAPIIL